jgi:hypothetical protein
MATLHRTFLLSAILIWSLQTYYVDGQAVQQLAFLVPVVGVEVELPKGAFEGAFSLGGMITQVGVCSLVEMQNTWYANFWRMWAKRAFNARILLSLTMFTPKIRRMRGVW